MTGFLVRACEQRGVRRLNVTSSISIGRRCDYCMQTVTHSRLKTLIVSIFRTVCFIFHEVFMERDRLCAGPGQLCTRRCKASADAGVLRAAQERQGHVSSLDFCSKLIRVRGVCTDPQRTQTPPSAAGRERATRWQWQAACPRRPLSSPAGRFGGTTARLRPRAHICLDVTVADIAGRSCVLTKSSLRTSRPAHLPPPTASHAGAVFSLVRQAPEGRPHRRTVPGHGVFEYPSPQNTPTALLRQSRGLAVRDSDTPQTRTFLTDT